MQSALLGIIKSFNPFSTILGLTTGLTFTMLALLLFQPGHVSYQGSCTGYAKTKRAGNNPLFIGPALFYPVHPTGARDGAESYNE